MTQTRKNAIVKIRPEVLRWAIRASGWKIYELEKKLSIKSDTIEEWLSGSTSPTLGQLEKLSRALRRPLAVFFLPKPPEEMPIPPDFRILPGRSGEYKKETLLALRRARRYQRICRVLLENSGDKLEPLVRHVTLSTDPLKIAREERKEFKLTEDKQQSWKNPYQAFKQIRRLLEMKNIFVFHTKMPIEDARGFVLADTLPVVIVVSSSDLIVARIFTLAHEYGHVLLNQSSIDMPDFSYARETLGDTERWCNKFASEFLLPAETLTRELESCREELSSVDCLFVLSRRYKVSKEMLAYKMQDLGIISRQRCTEIIEQLRRAASREEAKGGRRGLTTRERCLREKGERFVSLVSRNMELGTIGYHEAIDYLSVDLKNLDKVLAKAER
jgi:Zn-dependent peptidase ImmA (M78 family)